jgi:hypothetical protein
MVASSSSAMELARSGRFPDTRTGIHLEMVFNLVPFQTGHLSDESGVIDVVWGSYSPDQPPDVVNAFYIPFSVDDPFSSNSHDIAWYQANHPDWMEYKCDRVTLAYQFGDTARAPLDFANPAVRAYQWSSAIDPALAAGYESVAVDELSLFNDFHRCGHFDPSHNWVGQYSGNASDPKYRRDVLKWQSLTFRHIHKQSRSATMQLNAPYDPRASIDDNRTVMTTTDLLFDERGFTNYGNVPNVPTPQEWLTIVDYLNYVQSQGVCYMLNGEEPGESADITPQERQWAIGNYLLVKGDCTYMYMTGQQKYGDIVTFPEYSIPIGRPSGAMFQAQGVWERDFGGGLTLVNPYDNTAVVALPHGHWKDVDGHAVASPVTLQRQTALILLKAH